MARRRRKWLRRILMLGGIAAIVGARQKKMDENERKFAPKVSVNRD